MWSMLQQEQPDDYVVATDETHTVGEFVEEAFKRVGLEWQKYVSQDERFMRPVDVNFLKGDYSKARNKLGWQPETRFSQLVDIMADEDLGRWQRCLKGERFPWDAQNYPGEDRIVTRMTGQK
jgi:GDPmannose 4,6-dehydratase